MTAQKQYYDYDYDKYDYDKIGNYFFSEYDLILLNNEIDDIINVIKESRQ